MSSILLVTPFAPQRDGIATYAAQELKQLRAAGHKVDVVSPQPSAAHFYIPLGGPAGILKLVQLATGYDRTILQFGPEMLFGRSGSAPARAGVWAALAALAHACSLDLRIHELEYDVLAKSAIERAAARRAVHATERITVHTDAEANQLAETMGIGRSKVEVIEQGANFLPRTMLSRREAKQAVGIDPDRFAFVSIGFLQHHKGFDLAAEAMLTAAVASADLHIVGSRRVSHPDINRYVEKLQRLCSASAKLNLHERFVSHDEFDQWIRAADAVVLPYREIWSSSVIERAELLGTRVIASDIPRLRQQAKSDSVLVSGVGDLRRAMEQVYVEANYLEPASTSVSHSSSDSSWGIQATQSSRPLVGSPDTLDLQWVQTQVESRARRSLLASGGDSSIETDSSLPFPSESLMALGQYERPEPVSHRLGVSRAKRTVLSLINWQLAPIVQHVEDLQRATTEAIVRLEHRQNQIQHQPIDVTDDGSQSGAARFADSRPVIETATVDSQRRRRVEDQVELTSSADARNDHQPEGIQELNASEPPKNEHPVGSSSRRKRRR